MKEDPKKSYENFRKKFDLPGYKEFTTEFGFHPHDGDTILHECIDGITQHIEDVAKMLESLIFVDSGSPPSHLYQAKMLREKDVDTFDLLKKLMKLYWYGKKVLVIANEKEMAEFIKKSFKEWRNDLKGEVVKIWGIFETEWENAKLREIPSSVSYFG